MARILVVDGHDPVRWALTNLLRSAGYQVDQAANGLEALECCAETPFDAVLIDVYLPGMNGLEACRKLRQDSQVPILMVSAHHDPSLKQEAMSSGASAFFPKPMEFEGLLAWVRVTLPAQAGTNSNSMAYCN